MRSIVYGIIKYHPFTPLQCIEGVDGKRINGVDGKRINGVDEKRINSVDEKRINGIDGKRVHIIGCNGHGAAFSELETSQLPLTVESIKTFHSVIECLADTATTIPLRFGSIFKTNEEMKDHLKNNKKRYDMLMEQIDGCVEMSISLLLNDDELKAHTNGSELSTEQNSSISGRNYLLNRKTYYHKADQKKAVINRVVSEYRKSFNGIYQNMTFEFPTSHPSSGKLSLYFLINRSATKKFTAMFNRMQPDHHHHLSLSGPWPPYNFVSDHHRTELTPLTLLTE